MKKSFACLALCLAFLVAIPAAGAGIIIGNPPDPGTGNSFPWGSAYNAEYQQVYGSSDFNGPIIITSLEFYNTQLNSGSTQLPSGDWTISLSTTQSGVGSISGNFVSNEGPDNTQVFSGNINQPWTFGCCLQIVLSTPFTYQPTNGNLLMDVVASGVSAPGGSTFFDVNSTGSYFSRVYCPSGIACGNNGTVDIGYGLVTGFNSPLICQQVPEVSNLAMLLGFGTFNLAAVLSLRRKLTFGSRLL